MAYYERVWVQELFPRRGGSTHYEVLRGVAIVVIEVLHGVAEGDEPPIRWEGRWCERGCDEGFSSHQ